MKALLLLGVVAATPLLVAAQGLGLDGTIAGLPTVYIAAAAVAVLAVLFLMLRGKSRPANAPPMVPYKIPYLGHVLDFAQPVQYLKDAHAKYGDVLTIRLFGKDVTFFNSTETRKAFFEAPEEVICARKAYSFTIPVFGKGVVYDSPHQEFAEQRKFCAGGLTQKRFQLYTDLIRVETLNYAKEKMGDQGKLDFYDVLNEITLRTSTKCLQGSEVHSRFNSEFAQLYNNLDAALGMISFFWPGAPLPLHWRRDTSREKIKKLYKEIIDHRRSHPEEVHEDLIATLMESRYSDGSKCTDEEIVGMCTGVLLAGQHTSNVTSTWLGLFMLSNPDIYKRVMEEHNEVCPMDKPFAPFTYDTLSKMEYLERCIKETLRMRPPIIMVFRYTEQDFQVKNFVVPKDTLVAVAPALANSNKEVFTNPDTYDPDRFSKERQEDKKAPFAYIPFSAGRHACIGEKFAYLQVKAIWATFLHYYEFQVEPHSMLPDYTTMIAGPVKPVSINYKRRKGVSL